MTELVKDSERLPPFETADLRANLAIYLDSPFDDPSGSKVKVGNYKWGVYAFFDYDGEPRARRTRCCVLVSDVI
jgi:hypothetical protein